MPGAQSRADGWKAYRLAEVTFEAPAGWTQSSSERNREIILADPAGRKLRVEWWFEDEPILGYADIVSHKRITVGGKNATWVHSSFPDLHSVTAVLDEKRKDGRKFLMVLQAPGRDAAVTIRLFDEILARVSVGKPGEKRGEAPGQPPVAAAPAGQRAQPPPPSPGSLRRPCRQSARRPTGELPSQTTVEWKQRYAHRVGLEVPKCRDIQTSKHLDRSIWT